MQSYNFRFYFYYKKLIRRDEWHIMYERIRNLREDKDLSQKKMANILNVAQTTYSDYELGKINIPIEVLKKLALFLIPVLTIC